MRFSDIYGQNEIKKQLIHSFQNERLAHALLFHGPEGNGKLALAIAFAQYIACPNKTEHDSCGECPSCIQFQKLVHPDLHFSFPIIVKDHKISQNALNDWRELVLKSPYISFNVWNNHIRTDSNTQLQIPVAEGLEIIREMTKTSYKADYRTMIICFPEKMTNECANKLLKIIEEPYPKTLFILISDNPEQILGTVFSRLQRIYIPALQSKEIAEAMKKQFPTIPENEIADVSRISNGNIIKATDILTNGDETQEFLEKFIFIMRTCYTKSIVDMKNWAEELGLWKRKKLIAFFNYSQRMIRENFIYNLKQNELNYMTYPERSFSEKFSPFINEKNICQFLSELELAEKHIGRNGQAKIILFDLTLKMTMLLKM